MQLAFDIHVHSEEKLQLLSIGIMFIIPGGLIVLPTVMKPSFAAVGSGQGKRPNFLIEPPSSPVTNITSIAAAIDMLSLFQPGNTSAITVLGVKMLQITASNKPEDIATLAYIWGYPLVTVAGSFTYYTNPKTAPNPGEGPTNTISFARQLSNTTYVQYVSPNVNVLYGNAWLDLTKGPVVLTIPPIPDRYYVFQFMDSFGSVFRYVGARTTGSTGGVYLVVGPEWNGQVPSGMTEIKTPTNLAWISNRILVKGLSDLHNIHAIQDQIGLVPLSVLQGKLASLSSPLPSRLSLSVLNAIITSQFRPSMIPAAGIKVYDAISEAMVGNPQSPPDPQLLSKFASIGIGPGKTP